MNVPTPTMEDVSRSDRKKLKELMDERAVLGYAFSFQALLKTLRHAGLDVEGAIEAIHKCVLATQEKCKDKTCGTCIACHKDRLNDAIMKLYSENGIEKVIRDTDPFGTPVDYAILSSSSSFFNKNKALQWAVANGISAKKFGELWEAGQLSTPYTTLTARPVKERRGEDE